MRSFVKAHKPGLISWFTLYERDRNRGYQLEVEKHHGTFSLETRTLHENMNVKIVTKIRSKVVWRTSLFECTAHLLTKEGYPLLIFFAIRS